MDTHGIATICTHHASIRWADDLVEWFCRICGKVLRREPLPSGQAASRPPER